ncbi:hypothetical protein TNCV_4488491 [Trichonephila clavipes]|nr:hypothetical protein TNCV_4488491 [Trichonephila clavipes]
MTQEKLSELATISIESEISERMDSIETIDKFASQKARKVDEFIASTFSSIQNMKDSLERRHIRSLHVSGRHPRIDPEYKR